MNPCVCDGAISLEEMLKKSILRRLLPIKRDILYDYVNLSISIVLVLIYFFKTYAVNYYIYLLSPFKKNDFKKGKPTKLRSKRKKILISDNASSLSYYKNNSKTDVNRHSTISSIFKIKNQLY